MTLPVVHELPKGDTDHRVQFCELLMHAIDENQICSEWILFSDDTTFTLSDHVNKNNKSGLTLIPAGGGKLILSTHLKCLGWYNWQTNYMTYILANLTEETYQQFT